MNQDISCSCERGHGLCTSKIKLFQSLPHQAQKKLVGQAQHKDYKRQEPLFYQGDLCNRIHIIRQGKVKLSKIDLEGKENILDILIEGDVIGEELFLRKEAYPYEALSISPVKTCEIQTQTFESLLQDNPQTSLELIHSLSRKLRDQEERNAILAENDGLKKLAAFLLQRRQKLNSPTIELSLEEIAASINLRPETVSRKIKELIDQGIIQRNKKSSLTIIDREKLKEIP